MTACWAIALPIEDAPLLGRLRCAPGLEVCEQGDVAWLRGSDREQEQAAALRALPGIHYVVLPEGQTILAGTLVPHGHLPLAPWVSLSQRLAVQVAPPALGGKLTETGTLRIVRGGPFREANVLLTDLESWRAYAGSAPRVRLEQWAFAVSAAGVVVRGSPLPSITGVRYVAEQGVAVPCGYTWTPAVDAVVVREMLCRLADEMKADDLALLHADGTWDHIRAEDFVRATRSAVRASTESAVP